MLVIDTRPRINLWALGAEPDVRNPYADDWGDEDEDEDEEEGEA